MELRLPGGRVLIAYRLNRSFAWNAVHPPRLPPKPRTLRPAPVHFFDKTLECPVGIAAGLFLFNPAVWFSMSVWGQTHVFSLFLVLLAVLLAEKRLPLWACLRRSG